MRGDGATRDAPTQAQLRHAVEQDPKGQDTRWVDATPREKNGMEGPWDGREGEGKRAARVGGIETNERRRARARARPRIDARTEVERTDGRKKHGLTQQGPTTTTKRRGPARRRWRAQGSIPQEESQWTQMRADGSLAARGASVEKERNSRGRETRRQGFGNEGTDAVDPNACTHALHDSDA